MNKAFSKVLAGIFFTTAIIVTINSCKKDEPDTDTQASTDNSICEGEFSRLCPHTNGIAVGDSGVQKDNQLPVPFNGDCYEYYILDTVFPIRMMIVYGDTDGDLHPDIATPCSDGKSRMGVIVARFQSPWGVFPATVIMDLDTLGYEVNGLKFEGIVSLTKTSPLSFHQVVTGGKCSSSTWNILWNSDRTISMNLGDLVNLYDDYSLVSGTASGTNRNGKDFSVDITTALKRTVVCQWISEGAMTIKIQDKKDRTVDYGNGTCDNKATVTIDGNTFEFTLQ